VSTTNFVGAIAVFLSVAFIWPQVIRVFVKRSTEGLVPLSFLQGCCGSTLWTIYGIQKPNLQVALSNFLVVVAIVLILSVCEKDKKIVWWLPILVIAIIFTLGIFVSRYSLTLMGWFTVAVGTPAIIPQVVRVYQTERLYGVSSSMYGLLVVCCLTWFGYGALIGDWFVAIPNIVGATGGLYIWIRAVKSHKKYSSPQELQVEAIQVLR
jgi:uncharacterized protein with PQ loop repeat